MSTVLSKSTRWLSRLTLIQLRRVAFLIGAPTSGTKTLLATQIQRELQDISFIDTRANGKKLQPDLMISTKKLSIISIDMGIRNLAYAHLLADSLMVGQPATRSELPQYSRPTLAGWKRVVISGDPVGTRTPVKRKAKPKWASDMIPTLSSDTEEVMADDHLPKVDKEAFDPATFAKYAYDFIKNIMDTHRPTHVLIERQRFRSGGASAVQEWTIRVGVFEGMLHAVLMTLSEEQELPISVQSIDPARVTRYWVERRDGQRSQRVGSRKDSKKAKIDIVGRSLQVPSAALVDVSANQHDPSVNTVVEAFLARWKPTRYEKKIGSTTDVVKLDDLSDCFLQGIAWLNWQHKRQQALLRGAEAFRDDPIFESFRAKESSSDKDKSLRSEKPKRSTRRTPQSPKSSERKPAS